MRFTSVIALSVGLLSMTASALPTASPNTVNLVARDETIVVSSDTGDTSVSVANTNEIQGGGGTDIADALLTIASQVNHLIAGMIAKDIAKREKFTQEVVSRARNKRRNLNWIIVNTKYAFNGNAAVRKTIWFDQKVGKDVSYDVIGFTSGIFDLQGDGGFSNWAYVVDTKCVRKGGHIHC